MNISFIVDGMDCTSNLILPIKWNALLDERLDEGRVSLRNTSVSLFGIGAPVVITVENETIDFIISADESSEISVGSGKYNHELSLIEPTKILEGIIVENLTFTNALGRTYSNGKQHKAVREKIYGGSKDFTDTSNYVTPVTIGYTLEVEPFGTAFYTTVGSIDADDRTPAYIIVERPNGTQETIKCTSMEDLIYSSIKIPILLQGIYTITYTFHGSWTAGLFPTGANYKYAFSIMAATNYYDLPKWNIFSVIDRVLELSESHLQRSQKQFKIDISQKNILSQIESPEFTFSNMTLKEILDQIGGFIHGLPRLIKGETGEYDTIHYDMLGEMIPALIADSHYISEILSQNIENYATELDSAVNNFINTLDGNESALTEPFENGFRSVRSEKVYARIEEKDMVIETSLPIYSIQKLEVITNSNQVGDITDYVFEGAEYGRLSSFEGDWPLSKAYAIYYNIGEKNIRGLSFKSDHVIDGSLSMYSISNIILRVTGWNISADWWGKDNVGNYPRLSFRITYTPIFSSRVLQHKPFVEKNSFKRTLAYNQNANLIETQFYGENMKGAVMRMGNPEIIRTYRKADLSEMPKIGQVWIHDGFDYYVASITTAVYNDNVDITVGYSRDYNRLSQYIGINAEWRAYEVSERTAYYRDNIFTDFIFIGFDENIDTDRNEIGEFVHHAVAATFAGAGTNASSGRITCALVTTYSETEQQLNDVTLPVISTSFGNSLVFSFGMQDNFSAGTMSVKQTDASNIKGYWQTDARYTDYYGRVKYVTYILGESGQKVGFGDDACFDLPAGNFITDRFYGRPVRIKTDNKLVIDKDGNEILRFNYVVQFVTNDKDIIIGPALTKNNPMIGMRALNNSASLYILQEKVNKFATTIDLSQATKVIDFGEATITIYAKKFTLPTGVASVGGEAWAIADKNGALLLARNVVVEQNKSIEMPTFSINHKLP